MSHYELGKAVFIATVILVKPSIAQSPATNQTAMPFAVENRAIRLSAAANGIPVRFLVVGQVHLRYRESNPARRGSGPASPWSCLPD